MTRIADATTPDQEISSLLIQKEAQIDAPPDIVWQSVLDQLGPESQMPDGKPFPFTFEAWPGGRWFRDLGNNTGHFWGHVQVIKPPALLEISGPLFMSYPAINFLQYRLVADGKGTRLNFTHRAIGQMPAKDREGVNQGWEFWLKRIRDLTERRKGK